MIKIRLLLAFSSLLLICLFANPLTISSAITNQQLVILDLPYLDFQQLSNKFPNLKQLVSTGSTGLVRVPLISSNPNSFVQHAIEQISRKRSIKTIYIYKKQQPFLQQSCTTVVINGENFINFKDKAPGKPQNYNTDDLKTGADSLLNYYHHYRKQAGIILITFTKSHFNHLSKMSYQKIQSYYDYLVSGVSAETNFHNTFLIICSFRPPNHLTIMDSALTPIVIKGLYFTKGILYASSTRKSGIITLNDLRSIILSFLNPKIPTIFPIKSIPGEWRTVYYNQHALIKNYNFRWPLLTIYGYLLIGIIILFMSGFIFHLNRTLNNIPAWSFLYLLTIPAAFLLEALFDPLHWISIIFFTFLITGSLFLTAYFFSKKDLSKTLLFISFFTTGLVLIDGLFNGYYEHKSFLGYSLVAGARYYGIGNEYMGILLGSYIVGVTLSLKYLKQWRREFLWPATIVISLILIHPYCGADVGGAITALIGLGITNYLWIKQSLRFKEIARLLFLTLFIVIFMAILDLYVYKSSMSHLGKLLLSVQNHGIGVFIDLVIRKLALNLRLITSTPLTAFLIGALLIIPILYRFPSTLVKKLMTKYPDIISGCVGLSATALIGLLTNDSGIVSAAMTFLFGIGLIIVLIAKEYSV